MGNIGFFLLLRTVQLNPCFFEIILLYYIIILYFINLYYSYNLKLDDIILISFETNLNVPNITYCSKKHL
jgi:hypothetical protein